MKSWQFYIKSFSDYLRIERGLSENTLINYQLDIQKLTNYLEHHQIEVTPLNITEDILKAFIYHTAPSINARSQARLLSGLKSFFQYLIFEDYRADHPLELIETPKIGRKLPDTLSVQDINALIAAINLTKEGGERNKAMLETLYGCGLRVSELINLKISDLFFDEGFIKVTGKGNKQRLVPISNFTQKNIFIYKDQVRNHQSIQKGHEDFLFLNRRGKQLTRAMVFTIIKQLANEIGLHKNISPHTFRHSFATHLLENGADLRAIQLMLGHESITTTEVYVHLDRKHLNSVMEKFHPRVKWLKIKNKMKYDKW